MVAFVVIVKNQLAIVERKQSDLRSADDQSRKDKKMQRF